MAIRPVRLHKFEPSILGALIFLSGCLLLAPLALGEMLIWLASRKRG